MGLFDRLFGKTRGLERPALDLDPLMRSVHLEAGAWDEVEVDIALVVARLADMCRDAGLKTPSPDEARTWIEALDDEGRRRLALVVEVIDEAIPREALVALAPGGGPFVLEAVVATAGATSALTLDLVRQSPLRVEELARHLAARLGAAIAGEQPAASQERLERLDYGALLAEAERARVSAEDRMEFLRKRQEDLDARFQPRGKW